MGMRTRIHLKERKGGVCQWGRQMGKTNIPCSFARFAENGVGGGTSARSPEKGGDH